ncbi:MAG: hypothetical protein N2B06_04890 [Clostridium sp.]
MKKNISTCHLLRCSQVKISIEYKPLDNETMMTIAIDMSHNIKLFTQVPIYLQTVSCMDVYFNNKSLLISMFGDIVPFIFNI